MPTPMSSVLKFTGTDSAKKDWLRLWPVALGLLVLFVPTYVTLAQGAWEQEENSHGPIILAILVWLFWQSREAWFAVEERPAPVSGWTCLILGLLMYVLGRSQAILVVEVVAQIPILLGTILLMKGWQGLRALAFPLLFLIFLIPLPGFLVSAITGPLKREVSVVAEHLMYFLGYPIARSGVVLSIGPYQLLVADACSGLNSMYSLSALGLLYIYLMRYRNWAHIGLLLLSILPIAFISNVVRVIILVLVTYHLGDSAGQGFLHGFAGLLVFVVALVMLFVVDKVLSLIPYVRESRGTASR